MPTVKRTPLFQVRLSANDLIEFDTLCRLEGKKRPEMARLLIREELARRKSEQTLEIESAVEKQLKKMENRIAGLWAKMYIDLGVVYHVLWHRSDPGERGRLWEACRKQAAERCAARIKEGPDRDLKELIANEISGKA